MVPMVEDAIMEPWGTRKFSNKEREAKVMNNHYYPAVNPRPSRQCQRQGSARLPKVPSRYHISEIYLPSKVGNPSLAW